MGKKIRKVWNVAIEVLSLALAFDMIAFVPLAILEGIRWLFGEMGARMFEAQVAVVFLFFVAVCIWQWRTVAGKDRA